MNTALKRMSEFVWYHINGDGDCNGQVLREYARAKNLTRQDCFDLAYFYSTTYCCVSAVYLLQHRREIMANPAQFAREHKGKLIFQSDRKYTRMLDHFERVLKEWRGHMCTGVESFAAQTHYNAETIDTEKALDLITGWYFFSRFSAYLFVETYCDIFGMKATPVEGLNYEGDSMTFAGGLFYVFDRDVEARFIHEHRKLPVPTQQFEDMIRTLQKNVRRAGGDDSLVKLETSLCAYEKFFKGTRYNGYYADRQLAEIEVKRTEPEFAQACSDLLLARSRAINDQYLGERHGWHGIRTQLKKTYRQTQQIIGCPG